MNSQLKNIQSKIRHNGRGITSEYIIKIIKELWDRFGVYGYGIGTIGLFILVYYLIQSTIKATGSTFDASEISSLAILIAVTYVGWIGFITYEEYTDLSLSRSIRQRPSIATVDDAFGLLQSKDHEARVNASYCLSAVVSTSPKNVVNTINAPTNDIIEYLLPYLSVDDPDISKNTANIIAFIARDYPGSVKPYREDIIDLIEDSAVINEVRGELALTVGFLMLSEHFDDKNELQNMALELSKGDHPRVRIGSCYMLAGINTRETRRRLQHIADNDSDEEVRDHAEELV
jgi:hypothetical protein